MNRTIYKIQIVMQENTPTHNKQEYPPMHTCEHILNQTMIRMFDCPRSRNCHIERKKSKCDYIMPFPPSQGEIDEIQDRVNYVISQNMDITTTLISRDEVPKEVDLSKLPTDASNMLRIVRVGDYDVCACIGEHVKNTSEIGTFKIISHDWNEGILRLRFKLI